MTRLFYEPPASDRVVRQMRVLLIDNDGAPSQSVRMMLKSTGIIVDQADTGEEALELLRLYQYDIVVLELILPGIKGHEVVRRIRATRMRVPILILSSLPEVEAKVKAFMGGVDDYLTKPVDTGELIARIQAIIRRSNGFSQSDLRVGSLELNLNSRQVRVDGREVPLTKREYAILEQLMLRKGAALSKEEFLNHLYGSMAEPYMKTIDLFIHKLRKKLAQAGACSMIGTVRGRGYVLREPSGAGAATGPRDG